MKQNQSLILVAVIFVLTILSLVAIREFNIYYPVRITNVQASDFIISGEGKIDVIPDTAYINVGITANNETSAQAARDKMNEVNNKLVEIAKTNGIAAENIKTSNYSINPREEFNPNGNTGKTSYYGNASLTIVTTDKPLAEALTTKLTDAGANNISISFGIEDPNKYREEARNKAIENAQAQAKQLADQLNIKLGKVTNVVEGNSSPVPLYAKSMMLDSAMGGSVNANPELQQGTQTITSTVTLYFEKL